jgi:hypothetical protein
MIKGEQFLYQGKDGTVYYVEKNGVQEIRSWYPEEREHLVALVDGDSKDYEPKDMLTHQRVKIILAASPKGSGARWVVKQAGDVRIFATQLWSPNELFIAGSVLISFLSTLD